MASPKAIIQIFITGTRILGKAFWEAGRQAAKNARSSPAAAMGNDSAGVGHATSGSPTDQLTRQHRMTLDEAQLILNVKRGDDMKQILKNYEHLFKANSPPPPPEKPVPGKKAVAPTHSHYLQSKVFRARERIEAEMKIAEAPKETPATGPNPHTNHPPDPPHAGQA
ncbi:Mitochondrial import inner membrane translocase subunit tim16 [Psilocybe cubensis]|uniref:Mitochondrial import inner membrane translocase subunit tim16 n=2 Tax=Psilocybe cubensis TaxID=181762 RepID=A0ACB8HCI8_PSICU|nr:Mitochondrial import inner membrane translocase subunit tim16 [Psilocybe cubensis]KAH9485352.1 Mitochondrial import inner membrane translocase subunit tim16 [Psilocybe cubensis]